MKKLIKHDMLVQLKTNPNEKFLVRDITESGMTDLLRLDGSRCRFHFSQLEPLEDDDLRIKFDEFFAPNRYPLSS